MSDATVSGAFSVASTAPLAQSRKSRAVRSPVSGLSPSKVDFTRGSTLRSLALVSAIAVALWGAIALTIITA